MESRPLDAPKNRKEPMVWIIASVVIIGIGFAVWLGTHDWRPRSVTIQGALIRRDDDVRKERPIAGATVVVSDGVTSSSAESDAAGYFKVTLRTRVLPGKTVSLNFRQSGYRPLQLDVPIGLKLATRGLYVAALEPIVVSPNAASGAAASVISNLRVRYTVNLAEQANVGSAVKTFSVMNHGNVPCKHQDPCSPDGTWKAATTSVTIDAGQDNEFRNVRASCIAGPCPFTRIDIGGAINGSRNLTVSVVDWSDTATFLLEAEVFHDSIDSSVRESYPVVYGRALSFTVPLTQEGVSIEAELNGTAMVFPLGPELYLSWATCTTRSNSQGDQSTVYQCELKPGYRF